MTVLFVRSPIQGGWNLGGRTCLFMEAVSGSKSWEHRWSLQSVPHTRAVQAGVKKPVIIDYFLVSTLIRPLIQKCEVVKSVPWGPHNGVKLVLNIDFESVVSRHLMGKISKRSRRSTPALQEVHDTDQTEKADPTHCDEARRKCVFEGRKSLAVKTDRKPPKRHAPNMQAQLVSMKRQTSWKRFGDLE